MKNKDRLSRDLFRRARRKEKLKMDRNSRPHNMKNAEWYEMAYKKFSIFLHLDKDV